MASSPHVYSFTTQRRLPLPFLETFFESWAATEIPIWKVFKQQSDGTRTPLTNVDTWAATWERIEALREVDPIGRYHCGHGNGV